MNWRAAGSIRSRIGFGYTPIHTMQATSGSNTASSRGVRSSSFSFSGLSSGLKITRGYSGDGVGPERAHQHEELTDEAVRARQPDRRQGHEREDRGGQGHEARDA